MGNSSRYDIDVIFVSNGKNSLYRVTQAAIRSVKHSRVHPIVVESEPISYDALTIHPKEEFNYNRFLNRGAAEGHAPYIAFCNNDVLFTPDWLNILSEMEAHNLRSASPIETRHHKLRYKILADTGIKKGYVTGLHFVGWCFVWERALWEQLALDESFTFWCSDNIVCRQLQNLKISHGLVTSSEVIHADGGSKTLRKLNPELKTKYTKEEVKRWNRLTGENKFGWGIK